MIEMFVSELQMKLDLGPVPTPALLVDPLSLLKPETDPGWIEEILEQWDDLGALKDHRDLMCDDLRNNEGLSGSKSSDFQQSILHDLRDSIRVIGTRIRELEQL